MCGIAGQYAFAYQAGAGVDPDLVNRMSACLKHRGPDGEGVYEGKGIFLAHRRLKIIDLSDESNQPMSNEDETIWITYNGEVYNYLELRDTLKKKGHQFRTESDTEVIIHAYEEWGHNCLKKFNGMWAFALWDEGRDRLFCSRDRFGIKPFYWAEVDGTFLFASEIKALLEHPAVGREPDDDMVRQFLTHGILDNSVWTLYKKVFQIPPAHLLMIDTEWELYQYWQRTVSPELIGAHPKDFDNGGTLRQLLIDAVRVHLRSDVPVGTCLSGGIDSSTIATLVNHFVRVEHPESVGDSQKTFSITFDNPFIDESKYIDTINYTIETTGYKEQLTHAPSIQDIKRLITTQDGPFPSLSVYAQNRVMALAQGNVKVLLDGQGADELLAGYPQYIFLYIRTLLRSYRLLEAMKEGWGALCWNGRHLYHVYEKHSTLKQYQDLVDSSEENPRYQGNLDVVLSNELVNNLPALLHWEDRNSMAYSIEARVPFLDCRVVEYIMSLPLDQKIRRGATKHLLRKSMGGVVPRSILNRRDKKAFDTPEEGWMKEMSTDLILTFTSERFTKRPYWDAWKVARRLDNWLKGRTPYSSHLFRIFCTELWLHMYFDQDGGKRPAWTP